MATSGAFNGTDVFIRVNNGSTWLSVGGQLAHTETISNALIEITNKDAFYSYENFLTVDGENFLTSAGKQLVVKKGQEYRQLLPDKGIQKVDYSVDVIFCSQSGFNYVRQLAGNKGRAKFQVIRDPYETNPIPIELLLQVESVEDISTQDEPQRGRLNLMSCDAFDWDAGYVYDNFLTVGGDNFKTSLGEQLLVRQ